MICQLSDCNIKRNRIQKSVWIFMRICVIKVDWTKMIDVFYGFMASFKHQGLEWIYLFLLHETVEKSVLNKIFIRNRARHDNWSQFDFHLKIIFFCVQKCGIKSNIGMTHQDSIRIHWKYIFCFIPSSLVNNNCFAV